MISGTYVITHPCFFLLSLFYIYMYNLMHMSTVLRPVEYAFSLFFICMNHMCFAQQPGSKLSFVLTLFVTKVAPIYCGVLILSTLKLGLGVVNKVVKQSIYDNTYEEKREGIF